MLYQYTTFIYPATSSVCWEEDVIVIKLFDNTQMKMFQDSNYEKYNAAELNVVWSNPVS
jgi:hypothetical protein